jgi:hypothetical protein
MKGFDAGCLPESWQIAGRKAIYLAMKSSIEQEE